MPSMDTTKLILPREVASGIITKSRDTSVVQAMSPSVPQQFNDVDHIVFTREPEAEFVAEGAAKSSTGGEFKPVTGGIHKAQVTIRMNEEVRWADEDNQLQIIDALTDAAGAAMGRAVDYGILHAINPLTGGVIEGWKKLAAEGVQVSKGGNPQDDIDALIDAVNEEFDINGIALSKAYANEMRKLRIATTGQRVYPNIPMNLKVGEIDGVPAAVSGTVNGRLATAATNVLAILGDWSQIKWGIVRDLGMEVIDKGDPDGLGDLKRYNQIAYRTEVVYSWCVLDHKGFAVLNAPASKARAVK